MHRTLLTHAHRHLRRILPDFRPIILMYHRVAELDSDPWGLAVRPRYFAEQMEVLARAKAAMPLGKLVGHLREGHRPRRAVVVTFDDGYADNLIHAFPALAANDVPATLFAAAGGIGSPHEFWWDEIERILHVPKLPTSLELHVAGRTYSWSLDNKAVPPDRQWRTRDTPPTSRHRLYHDLWHLVRPLPPNLQRQVLEQIRKWAGWQVGARDSHRLLTESELRKLSDSRLVSIGGHTVTHPHLPDHEKDFQSQEIVNGRKRLEEITDRKVDLFAYPYGGFTPTTAQTVAEAGFRGACSTRPGPVSRKNDPFDLPRFEIGDWDGETFARHLSERFRKMYAS